MSPVNMREGGRGDIPFADRAATWQNARVRPIRQTFPRAARIRGALETPWTFQGFLGVFLVAALLSAAVAVHGSPSLRKGPYLLYTGDETTMMILWQLDESATCTLRWGTDASLTASSMTTQESGSDHQHKWLIRDLVPSTRYYYEVEAGDATYSGSFFAAPSSDVDAVKFLAYGDTRTFIDDHELVCSGIMSMISADPGYQTFLLHTGDWVEDGDVEVSWQEQFFSRSSENLLALQATSLSETMHVIAGHQMDAPHNFKVASAEGLAFDVESLYENCDILAPTGPFQVHTNHILSPRLLMRDALLAQLTNSATRLWRAKQLLGRLEDRSLDVEDMKSLLRDHFDGPGSICRHAKDESNGLEGVSKHAIIMDLEQGVMHDSAGYPCSTPFTTNAFDTPHQAA